MVEMLKEYNTVEVWTLVVAIATFIVTCLSYWYNRKSDKRRIKSEIAHKEAQIEALDGRYTMMGVDHTVADSYRVQKEILRVEIEQLRKEL